MIFLIEDAVFKGGNDNTTELKGLSKVFFIFKSRYADFRKIVVGNINIFPIKLKYDSSKYIYITHNSI